MEAVRVGDWKLHFLKGKEPFNALYNLREDVGETQNRYDEYPEVVQRLQQATDAMRTELGDSLADMESCARRPSGCVDNAEPLTEYREDHPHMIAMYDLPDMLTMAG